MSLDFEQEYGVNAGYVEELFEHWKLDASTVDEAWRTIFERSTGHAGGQPAAEPPAPTPALPSSDARAEAAVAPDRDEDGELELLSGIAGRIASNMEASLEMPTATSVRTLPCKVLTENRLILNQHMKVRALGKASFTHVIAFALARALGEQKRMIAAHVQKDGRGHRRIPSQVNLGLAIDVPGPKGGRMLVVPSIKGADGMTFAEFYKAYQDVVRRGRDGELGTADYKGTNVTLTNPGGFGTEMSVPRLMKGQGLIVATGSIGVPPQVASASAAALAEVAIGPIMTVTSTYDHRVIQGAESGLFLKRFDELLSGADGFYDDVFDSMRVPWTPFVAAKDARGGTSGIGASSQLGERSDVETQAKVWSLINAYRVRGCRLSDLDPLAYKPDPIPSLDPTAYGLTIWDLDRVFLCGDLAGRRTMTLREILDVLRRAYCRRWSIEYMHISDWKRKTWIRGRVENPDDHPSFTKEEILVTLDRLHRAENFERFLHAKYVGNKRFSLEGADTLIPTLAAAIERASEQGVEKVFIGMAHRGRLNVLVNILRKTYEQVFREFEGVLLPLSKEGSGDVKYHLGQSGTYETRAGKRVEVFLCANPSHPEAVDPVVGGMTRACQDSMRDTERRKVLAILIHGDAAFSGQGVVAECFNMSQLRAYGCGGTLHLVVNNQIGFTAGPRDLRSTYYCTDIAKSVQAPILHANGDYPESVLRAVRIAVDYQREFGADAVVDMVCYRRWGHNEGDEPAYTQPVLYSKIRKHPTVYQTYAGLLRRRGDLEESELDEIKSRFEAELNAARQKALEQESSSELALDEVIDVTADDPLDYVASESPGTGVPGEELVEIVDRCNEMPAGHVVHPNLLRQLRRRERMVRGEQGVDWGCAEALAFGALLREAVSIRISGQDSGRGTFSHRHAVIRDQVTEQDHVPLKRLARGGAEFDAWDSLLSEEAVLAFEYGYAVARSDALVIWEAQFGDFVNGAQIAIDQFISSGETKWGETSGVTLLLPHGYDGQGPEHSSARPERFLSLCSAGNMTVANCTTSAQYFHLIRRQGLAEVKRPLIVFTPKSLLRDKRAASSVDELATGRFRELLPDDAMPEKPRRILLSSGKVYYDLAAYRDEHAVADVGLVRVEQLYPIPRAALSELVHAHPGAELVWCQEEPRNMGAWTFVSQRFADLELPITYVGRPDSSSTATGSFRRHNAERDYLVELAFA
jgi:2-oxoglutarate decarboxylase